MTARDRNPKDNYYIGAVIVTRYKYSSLHWAGAGRRRHHSLEEYARQKMYLKINYGRQNIICRVVVHKGTDCQLCRFFGVYYYFFGMPFRCFLLLQKQTYYYLRYKYNIYYTRQNHAHLGRTTVGQPQQLLHSAVPLAILLLLSLSSLSLLCGRAPKQRMAPATTTTLDTRERINKHADLLTKKTKNRRARS